jgi:hypothetical protein
MTLKININTSEDIEFEAALLLSPASNYSDGPVKGERPAIRWAMVRLPATIIRSGVFNIKDVPKEATRAQAIAVARSILFGGDCLCTTAIDFILETYADEP